MAQNADSLFTTARNTAFDKKDYPAAIVLSKKALEINPSYTDVVVFTARLYTWTKQHDSARFYFQQALMQKPDLEDIYVGFTDLEYWSENYSAALGILTEGLHRHPASEDLLLRKAKILYAQREYKAAIPIADTVLKINRGNAEARRLAIQIQDNVAKNRIGVKYDYVSFDKQFPDPWQLVSIDYTRQTKSGPFTARVNYANRFKLDAFQYELESYPRFSKMFYGYFNAGYSDNTAGILPKWRMGTSLFANLPKAFEAELGIRYLYFTSDVFIYTAYVGKYYKSFLFGARTFLTPKTTNIAQTYIVMLRYYYGSVDDYVGLNVGTGLSPDDRRINVQLNSTYKLRSYTCELTARFSIRKLNIITANFSLLNQEYFPGLIGNQTQIGVGYIRRF